MNIHSLPSPGRALVALFACGLLAPLSHAAVVADPATVTFTAPQQSVTIKLTDGGAPVPAASIEGWKLLASGHDYKHMLTIDKSDGALTIAPSGTVEVGSYDLNIDTAAGPVVVHVFTPLNDVPDIVEKRAALTGQSELQVKQQLGLVAPVGPVRIDIDLPSVYYEGQTLELTMPPKPGAPRTYTWFMNGDLLQQGPDRNSLKYTFEAPGEYVLTYVETEHADGKLTTMGQAVAYTRVVAIPPVIVDVAPKTVVTYAAPAGYQHFVWRVDGIESGTGPELKHAFDTPGVHSVDCLATAPVTGPAQGFQRVRYSTNVR